MRPLSSELREHLHQLSLHGVTLAFPAAMVLSGAAFRHYFFNPAYNHAWLIEYPEDLWRNDTLRVENYGLFEAIEGHTGWASRRWQGLKGVELVQLLRHEQSEGRVLRQESTDAHPAGIVQSFEIGRQGLKLSILRGKEKIQLQSDIESLDDFSSSLPPFQSLRPVQGSIPPTRRRALTLDVFRWANRHWSARKEIVYDVQAFYAAGDQAWIDLQSFYAAIPALESAQQQAAHNYVHKHLQELACARQAAADFFDDHDGICTLLQTPSLSKRSTDALTAAWQKAADRIQDIGASKDEDLSSRLQDAHEVDTDAFAQLKAWTEALHRVTTTSN